MAISPADLDALDAGQVNLADTAEADIDAAIEAQYDPGEIFFVAEPNPSHVADALVRAEIQGRYETATGYRVVCSLGRNYPFDDPLTEFIRMLRVRPGIAIGHQIGQGNPDSRQGAQKSADQRRDRHHRTQARAAGSQERTETRAG